MEIIELAEWNTFVLLKSDVSHLAVMGNHIPPPQIHLHQVLLTLAWAEKTTDKKHQKMGSFEDGDHRTGGVEYVCSSEIGRITSSSDGKPHSSPTASPASSFIDFGVGKKSD